MGGRRALAGAVVCAVACLVGAGGSQARTRAAHAIPRATFHPRVGAGLGLIPPLNSRGMATGGDPASGPPTPLTYHAGQVMAGGVTVHTIFWAPSGYAFQGSPGDGIPTYEGMVQQFFTDVAHDSGADGLCSSSQCNAFTVLPQYAEGTRMGAITPGSYAIGYWTATDSIDDTDPYAPAEDQCASPAGTGTCVTDGQIQAEVDHIVQSTGGSYGLNDLWYVFLPPGVDECIDRTDCGTNAFAGYHSFTNLHNHGVSVYAVSIDPIIEVQIGPGSDPEGYPDAEGVVDVAAHETVEAMTDPLGTGWMDPNGEEVADKCDVGPQIGTPLGFDNGSPYNQVINGHHYLLQQMWANGTSGGNSACVQSTSDTANPLPLPQVNLRQFDPTVTGNVNRPSGGGIGVRVSIVRAARDGRPVVVARAATTTAADGSWSLSLAPHALGDDRDEIDIDYSGSGAPEPSHQVILTGNGGSPFTEAGWTSWFDLDQGSAATTSSGTSSLMLAPCFQAGVLGVAFDGQADGESATDFCNTQTNAATLSTPLISPADTLSVSSNDNRAFSAPEGTTPNPTGGLVSLAVPVGEANSVSQYQSPLELTFTPGGLPSCTADLELQAVACFGLVSGGTYQLTDGRQKVRSTADSTGTLIEPLFIRRGDTIALSNGVRPLTMLHVARLRVTILGETTAIVAGRCQSGDYFGSPLTTPPVSTAAGVPTNLLTGGTALTSQVCPASGDASGLPTSFISQTDDLSGGQTETEVPDIEDTSPMEGETMYGKFTALAESGLSVPGNLIIPTDFTTDISLRIATLVTDQTAFTARNVDTASGVPIPALKPGSYTATWVLLDTNRDARIVQTRFIEQAGRVGRGPRMSVACGFANGAHSRIRCHVAFPRADDINGTLRLRLTRAGIVVGLGHGRVRHGRAILTLKVLRQVSGGPWLATVVLARPHLIPVTTRAGVKSVS